MIGRKVQEKSDKGDYNKEKRWSIKEEIIFFYCFQKNIKSHDGKERGRSEEAAGGSERVFRQKSGVEENGKKRDKDGVENKNGH